MSPSLTLVQSLILVICRILALLTPVNLFGYKTRNIFSKGFEKFLFLFLLILKTPRCNRVRPYDKPLSTRKSNCPILS